jgi:hypothetical protein
MKYGRILEFLLGAFFIVSATAKALDLPAFGVQVRAYGVLHDKDTILTVARLLTGVEATLGAALLSGVRLRGLTLGVTALMLVGFTGLIAYAWAFQGLKDCGCFGKYVQTGPGTSILKNLALLGMAAGAWWSLLRLRPGAEGEAAPAPPADAKPAMASYITGGIGALIVIFAWMAGAPVKDLTIPPPLPPGNDGAGPGKTGPFARFTWEHEGETINLGQGQWLVAMLSATCEHCQASVPILNEFSLTLEPPRVAAIMMGTPEEMEEFRQLTQPLFPTLAIDALGFLEMIGKHPPRFYLVNDGASARYLDMPDDDLDVTLEQLAMLAHGQTHDGATVIPWSGA